MKAHALVVVGCLTVLPLEAILAQTPYQDCQRIIANRQKTCSGERNIRNNLCSRIPYDSDTSGNLAGIRRGCEEEAINKYSECINNIPICEQLLKPLSSCLIGCNQTQRAPDGSYGYACTWSDGRRNYLPNLYQAREFLRTSQRCRNSK
jgi:hypothetical protein